MRVGAQLRAWWVLGTALLRHVVTLGWRHQTATGWFDVLRRERIASTPAVSWQHVTGERTCIACGLCGVAAQEPTLPGLIQSMARRPEDAGRVASHLELVERCAPVVAKVCPSRVDALALVRLVRAQQQALEDGLNTD